MPGIFNPHASFGQFSWSWVSLCGPDARDFLHRLSSTNLKLLNVGQGAKGSFLKPQGTVLGFFTLWRYGNEDYAIEFDGGPGGQIKTALLQYLDRCIFAEKITVVDVGTLECRWIFDADPLKLKGVQPGETRAIDEEIRICHHGGTELNRPWISAWGRPARLSQWIDRTFPDAKILAAETLEAWRISALRPRVGHEITEDVLPIEVGLRDHIADNKGCYPGREELDRYLLRGDSPARLLARLEGTGTAPSQNETVLNLADPAAELGKITSVVNQDGRWQALALLRKLGAKEGLQIQTRSGSQGTIQQVARYA